MIIGKKVVNMGRELNGVDLWKNSSLEFFMFLRWNLNLKPYIFPAKKKFWILILRGWSKYTNTNYSDVLCKVDITCFLATRWKKNIQNDRSTYTCMIGVTRACLIPCMMPSSHPRVQCRDACLVACIASGAMAHRMQNPGWARAARGVTRMQEARGSRASRHLLSPICSLSPPESSSPPHNAQGWRRRLRAVHGRRRRHHIAAPSSPLPPLLSRRRRQLPSATGPQDPAATSSRHH